MMLQRRFCGDWKDSRLATEISQSHFVAEKLFVIRGFGPDWSVTGDFVVEVA